VAKIDNRLFELRDSQPRGSVRLLEKDDVEPVLRSVYEAARSTRAGMLTRADAWWTHRLLADPESWREGKSMLRHVVFEEDGSATGYAVYRQKSHWDDFVADGEIDVSEVITLTPAAHSGLWGFLTRIDLFPNLEWWNMPVDDPVSWKITDGRRVVRKLVDGLWLRVMDVPAALDARRYDSEGVVTFDLNDATRPETSGTYRLEVANGAGHCERVDAMADVALDADILGAMYLGGADAIAMAAGGRIGGDSSAVENLHRLFRSDQAPWCPEVF
jgi:predicted acetyltransferase